MTPTVDKDRLLQICETELMEYIGPAAFMVAAEAVESFQFLPGVAPEPLLRAFLVRLKVMLPADVNRDKIASKILDAYLKP